MKKKSTIFYNLEAQTNFLNKITNMENVVDNTHMDHSELRLLKVNKIFCFIPLNNLFIFYIIR